MPRDRTNAELWSALTWLATEYFFPDDSGRYGLPVNIGLCDCHELDRACAHVTIAENQTFEVEQILREAAARGGRVEVKKNRRPSWAE